MFKRFVVSGTKKNDVLTGTDRLDIMFGRNGDDVLDGRGGWDFLFGGKGNDKLFGGDGNDWLFGGKGKDELFGGDGDDKLFGGKGDDFLDGGAGSDYVFGGKGDDTFNFTLSENGSAKDYYDGGKGSDTLQLTLTSAELQMDSVKADIAAFEAFLDCRANPGSDRGKVFQFQSFDLDVKNFEKLVIVEVGGGENTAPVAQSASLVLNEDNSISFNLIATDADGDALTLAIVTGPTEGTLTPNDDGTYEYRPNDNFFGDDSFTFKANDGTVDSNVATISLAINPVNDSPVVGGVDNVTVTADVVMPDPIRVLVLGREDGLNTTTHVEAVAQLDPLKFDAHWRLITDDVVWADELSTYNVVVLGDSGYFDFSGTTTTELFSALNTFVTSSGNGVVTTGWFAQALPKITDPVAHGLADSITPIASALNHDYAGTGGPDPDVISIVADHEITAGVSDSFSLTTKFGWELAGGDINDGPTAMIDAGATLLATGVASNQDRNQVGEELPAIAYNDAVGMGRTAYLGGFYLSSTDFDPTAAHTDPVQDGLFERAIAWAAGGMGSATATATIDDALLLADATDVETPDDLFIDFVALQNANGASIELNAAGDIVYTPSADGLAALLEGNSISDSFDYRVSDGDDVSAIASISLTVDSPLMG